MAESKTKQVRFEGRIYNVPLDATYDEIDEYAQSQQPQQPVLREQPGTLERMTQPGGIASPENVGILGGALLGGAYGAPLGPLGVIGGGLIGAGAGGGLGRLSEIVSEYLYGPNRTPGTRPLVERKPSLGDVEEVGQATQRGIVAEMLGQVGGKAMTALGGKILRPFQGSMGPSGRTASRIAEELNIPITAAEIQEGTKAGSSLAILERQPPRYLGGGRATALLQERAKAAEEAATAIGEKISPGTAKDMQTVGEALQEAAQGRVEGLYQTAKGVATRVASDVQDIVTAGQRVKRGIETRFEKVNQAANRLYEIVRIQAGEAGEAIDAPGFLASAAKISEREKSLLGVQTKGARVARGAVATSREDVSLGALQTEYETLIAKIAKEPDITVRKELSAQAESLSAAINNAERKGISSIDPGAIPADLISQLGLNEPKKYSFEALREWQSRLGELIRNEKNRRARRDWAQMFAGVTEDIDRFGTEVVPELKPILDKANLFYRTQVAETYFNKTIGKINDMEADLLQKFFIRPDGSIYPLKRLEKATGADNYKRFVAAHFGELAEKSKVNGVFDVEKYLGEVSRYRPEVLEQLLGREATTFDAVLEVFKASPNKTIKAILQKPDDKILEFFVRPQGSVAPIETLRGLLSQETFDHFAGSAWKRIVDNSHDNTGVFSIDRFLTLVNSRTGYRPEQLKALLGNEHGKLREMIFLFEKIKNANSLGANPSGSGGAVLSAGQIISGTRLAGSALIGTGVATGIVQGDPMSQAAWLQIGLGGLVIMHPNLLARVLYSPGGIKWLTEGLKTPPGSKKAVEIANRIAAIAAFSQGEFPSVKEKVGTDQVSELENKAMSALKGSSVSLADKVQAAMGMQ